MYVLCRRMACVRCCLRYFLIWRIAKIATGKIDINIILQRKTHVDVNGYGEEMVNAQMAIKVFCREEKAKKELHKKNKFLAVSAVGASGHVNSMMPKMNVFDYVHYLIIAIIGAHRAINIAINFGLTGMLTLSMIVSFLTLSRNFTKSVS